MSISIEEVPHSNLSRYRYFMQVAPLSIIAYNTHWEQHVSQRQPSGQTMPQIDATIISAQGFTTTFFLTLDVVWWAIKIVRQV